MKVIFMFLTACCIFTDYRIWI